MLVLTDNAADTIRTLLDQPDYPDDAGLRISQTEDAEPGLTVHPTAGPGPDDQVIDEQGARVFVEPGAVELLAGMALDTEIGTEGQVRFNLLRQPQL